ncbi:MAG: hypothetical protein NZM25_08490 [Leptospiraceae bacterium]|nr:hypothetical protein [Leptospiraceae bacterium]MDW8306755.1 hypothetical protein [Leptospiraceae bacterium]
MKVVLKSLVILMTALTLMRAHAPFSQYQAKGNEGLKILGRLFERYHFPTSEKENFEQLKEDWRLALNRYVVAQSKEKPLVFRDVQSHYSRILQSGRKLCSYLESFSQDMLDDFSQRLKETSRESLPPEKYTNHLSVAKREFARAKEYLQKGHSVQAAHLYDRGIELLVGRYKQFQWPLPEKYFPRAKEMAKVAEK